MMLLFFSAHTVHHSLTWTFGDVTKWDYHRYSKWLALRGECHSFYTQDNSNTGVYTMNHFLCADSGNSLISHNLIFESLQLLWIWISRQTFVLYVQEGAVQHNFPLWFFIVTNGDFTASSHPSVHVYSMCSLSFCAHVGFSVFPVSRAAMRNWLALIR